MPGHASCGMPPAQHPACPPPPSAHQVEIAFGNKEHASETNYTVTAVAVNEFGESVPSESVRYLTPRRPDAPVIDSVEFQLPTDAEPLGAMTVTITEPFDGGDGRSCSAGAATGTAHARSREEPCLPGRSLCSHGCPCRPTMLLFLQPSRSTLWLLMLRRTRRSSARSCSPAWATRCPTARQVGGCDAGGTAPVMQCMHAPEAPAHSLELACSAALPAAAAPLLN